MTEQDPKDVVSWKEAESHVHPKIWADPHGDAYDFWGWIADVCRREWGWEYDGSCDLSGCETWRSILETLAAHKEKEWCPEWEEYEHPLD